MTAVPVVEGGVLSGAALLVAQCRLARYTRSRVRPQCSRVVTASDRPSGWPAAGGCPSLWRAGGTTRGRNQGDHRIRSGRHWLNETTPTPVGAPLAGAAQSGHRGSSGASGYRSECPVRDGLRQRGSSAVVVILRPGQSPREGHYPVLLFAADGSVAYLSLNQGTELHSVGEVKGRTERLRRELGELPARFVSEIDLHATTAGPRKYELGNVAAVSYPRAEVPADQVIERDLRTLIELTPDPGSDDGAEREGLFAARKAWIFQSIPEQYRPRRCST